MPNSEYLNFTNLNADTDFPYFVLDEKMSGAVPEPIRFHIMHWHDDFQFTYVEQGEIECVTFNERHTLQAGEAVFINENVLHRIIPLENASYKTFRFPRLLVGFYLGSPAGRDVSRIANNANLAVYILTKQAHQNILNLLQELSQLEQQKPSFYEYSVLTLLSRIWLALLHATQSIQTVSDSSKSTQTQRMRLFLHYIEHHYAEDISLENLAQSAYVSKSECLRCFAQTMHTTPYKYLIEFRLAKAERLLLESDLPIGDIAEQIGFNQISYFGKCFRKKTGCSPRAYRQKYKGLR